MLGEVAAPHADGVNFRHILRYSHKGGHRAEGFAEVVRVKPRHNNPHTVFREFLSHVHDALVEELGFVNSDHNPVKLSVTLLPENGIAAEPAAPAEPEIVADGITV